jgi:hypothetical protein
MKGIQKIEAQYYQNKNGVWNYRIVCFTNLQPKPLHLSGSNQGYENEKECKEQANSWTFKGIKPTLVKIKYYRLS